MSLDLGSLNWLAVIVGAVVYFAIGAVWFAPPLFGKPWMASIGWDESRPRPEMSPVTYVGPAIFYLVSAIATGLLAKATGTDTLTEGITLGLLVGVGYALVVTATDALFDPNKPKPWNWFAISGSYHVLSLVIERSSGCSTRANPAGRRCGSAWRGRPEPRHSHENRCPATNLALTGKAGVCQHGRRSVPHRATPVPRTGPDAVHAPDRGSAWPPSPPPT